MSVNLDKYLKTYSGIELLKKWNLDQVGVWHVRGEDPNCDMGGSHYQPSIGYFEGALGEILEFGIDLPGFWQWGAGGKFEHINVQKVDSKEFKRQQTLREEKRKLEQRLAEIVDEINGV